MGIKKSVFLSDRSEKIIRSMSHHDHPRWSQVINQTFAAMDSIFRNSLPALSTDDWQVIMNAYSSGTRDTISCIPFQIASDIMGDRGLLDVEQHPQKNLVKRIHAMTQAEQFAILTVVRIFYLNSWHDADSFSDIVMQIVDSEFISHPI